MRATHPTRFETEYVNCNKSYKGKWARAEVTRRLVRNFNSKSLKKTLDIFHKMW